MCFHLCVGVSEHVCEIERERKREKEKETERKREQTGVMDLRSNVLQQVRERGPPVTMEMTKPDQYSRL